MSKTSFRTLIGSIFSIFISHCAFSQSTIVRTSNYTQKINLDSINKAETILQKENLYFLTKSTTDSNYIKSPFYNRVSFSTYIPTDSLRRKRRG